VLKGGRRYRPAARHPEPVDNVASSQVPVIASHKLRHALARPTRNNTAILRSHIILWDGMLEHVAGRI